MSRSQPAQQKVIEGALWDWWITTDPLAQFDAADVAAHIDHHLVRAGYVIAHRTRRTPPVPTRRAIVSAVLLAATTASSTLAAAWRSDWWWAALGALATGLLTREGIRDINDRRRRTR
ncbi:hypothetical protein OQI_20475 [Streptomyces pharetrae CZA14]|uniref:Uncharacterized protein n=1 Tax=Streptomyces pharetrae CZA14 TaxID=1144883 RepID=A0ABX3YIG0_9ACTN|nr:hypothetical protein OQI_20475 [Streptomyces pharetrae CZA14]